jgi:peptidoglycan/LPS O-acetylase OafA/YrhL
MAALLVVLSHHAGIFWHAQPAVAALTGLPAAFAVPPPGTDFLKPFVSGPIQTGPAGVALFFLISGYVIPFSLRGRSRAAFLGARAIRLLPTYWAGFAFQVAVLLVALHLLGGTFPRTATEVVLNLLPGIHMLAWRESLDGIVWTLDIEVFFYVLAALSAPLLLARSGWALLLPAGVGLVGAALSIHTGWITAASAPVIRAFTGLSLAAPMLIFMSIGTVLHLAEDDGRWRRAAFLLVPAMLAAFAALMHWWPHGSLGKQTPSYLLMAAIFIAAFLLRDRIPAWRWPTRLAAISYPLYVVHGLSGYAIMVVAMGWGWPPSAIFALALAYSLAAATALHILVEEPTRKASGRIGRDGQRLPPREAGPVTDSAARPLEPLPAD